MNMKQLGAVALLMIVVVPIGLGYVLAVDEEEAPSWELSSQVSLSDQLLNSTTPYTATYTGTTNNTGSFVPVYNSTSTTVTPYPVFGTTQINIQFAANTWVKLPYAHFSVTIPSNVMYAVQYNGEDPTGDWSVPEHINTEYATTISTLDRDDVTHTWLKIHTTRTLVVTIYTPNGSYADPNYGWKIPQTLTWSNGQSNESITFTIDMSANGTIGLNTFRIVKDSSGVHVSNYTGVPGIDKPPVNLGNYRYLRVVLENNEINVTGLKAWTAAGDSSGLNTVTVKLNGDHNALRTVTISDSSTVASFRVDSTQITAGTFPSTKNYSLDLN